MSGILDLLDPPDSWDSAPFGRVVFRSGEDSRPDLELLSVFLDEGVVPRSSRDDNFNRPGADLQRYLVVRPGDIVFNKLRTWQGGLGMSRYEGIVSPAYFVCRPTSNVEPRFLHYLLRSRIYLSELTRVSKWMPPSQFDIAWDDLKRLPVLLPPTEEQRVIADFLDSETTRIDALVAKKRRVVEVLEEREASCRRDWFERLSAEHGQVRLRRLVRRFEQGWSPVCDTEPATEDEWGVLKTSSVSTGVFRADESKRLPSGIAPDLRWVVEDGDLLMTRGSGSIGRVGMASVARVSLRKLTISDLIYRAKLQTGSSEFVAAALVAPQGRDQIERAVRSDVGQTLKVRADDLKEVRVPAVAAERQEEQWRSLASDLAVIETVTIQVERQIDLLTERRQALITAAVTGELQVAHQSAEEAS